MDLDSLISQLKMLRDRHGNHPVKVMHEKDEPVTVAFYDRHTESVIIDYDETIEG